MYSDSVYKIIKEINLLERQLITDFGVNEPVRLVNSEFKKRFQLDKPNTTYAYHSLINQRI